MSKPKKIMFIICITLALFLLTLLYCSEKILSRTLTKQVLIQKLEASTGYHVSISNDLHWHYFPSPTLSIDSITFHSAQQQTMQFHDLNISVNLAHLIKKQVDLQLTFKDWQQNQLHFTHGSAKLIYENKLLSITKFNAEFYQGKIQGTALIHLEQITPQFEITASGTQIDIQGLLNDIAENPSLSGKMDFNAKLKSTGSNADQFIEHLNGPIRVFIKNGKLNTIHLGNSIPYISSNNEKEQIDFFDSLTIQSNLENGIAHSDIILSAKNYAASGQGDINLNQQSLNITLNAYYTRSQKTKNIALPIHIQGPIKSPKVSINLTQSLNQLLNEPKLIKNWHRLLNTL